MITMAIDVHATIVGKEWSCKRMWMAKGIPSGARHQLLKKPKPDDAQVFGYARVSTQDQKLDMQLEALRNAGVPENNIYVEKVSGGSKKRPQFSRLIRALRPGDTVIVWKMDRFGRKALPLLQHLAWFKEHDIEFKSLTEQIDFDTPMGRVFASITAAMAQFEVEMTAFRTKTGIATAQAQGKAYGRKVEFNLPKAKAHLLKHKNLSAAAKHVGVTRQRLMYHVQRDPALARLKLK